MRIDLSSFLRSVRSDVDIELGYQSNTDHRRRPTAVLWMRADIVCEVLGKDAGRPKPGDSPRTVSDSPVRPSRWRDVARHG